MCTLIWLSVAKKTLSFQYLWYMDWKKENQHVARKILWWEGKRANRKTEVARKHSTLNFPKANISYPLIRTRTCHIRFKLRPITLSPTNYGFEKFLNIPKFCWGIESKGGSVDAHYVWVGKGSMVYMTMFFTVVFLNNWKRHPSPCLIERDIPNHHIPSNGLIED